MAAQTLPSFVTELASLSKEDRVKAIQATHFEYAERIDSWRILMDAFEGAGGFLSGEYLWRYRSEGDVEFSERKAQARYHNYIESIVDIYVRHVFGQGVKRTTTNAEYAAWCEDVDGTGTTLTSLLQRYAAVALVAGHAGMLIDKTPDQPTGPAKADETGRVIAQIFTAQAIVDWRAKHNGLSAVKLAESGREESILRAISTEAEATSWLIWSLDGWARFDADGVFLGGASLNLGLVPFVALRPKPSYRSVMLGRPLTGNAHVIVSHYNRSSEEDETLRSQAFSLLTVSVNSDSDVDRAREQLGSVIGTSKAVVVNGTIDYKTPDQTVPENIRANASFLVRELYRAAHVRQPRESAQVETAEAIKLQNSELSEMLHGVVAGLQQAEQDIARAWFAWMSPTPELAARAFDAANLDVVYPSQFFLEDLLVELAELDEGVTMNLGDTMTTLLKVKAAHRLFPAMSPVVAAQVESEIKALVVSGDGRLDTGTEDDTADEESDGAEDDAP